MTKYGSKKKTVSGIVFDSIAEAEFYKKLLLAKNQGAITKIVLQPKYMLQEGFKKDGKTYKPIQYKADFLVTYKDGSEKIIDVKSIGTITEVFKIKQKLFEKRYPELHLTIFVQDGDRFTDITNLPKGAKTKNGKKAKTFGASTKGTY